MNKSFVFSAILISLATVFQVSMSVKASHKRSPHIERIAFSAGRTSHLSLRNGTTVTYDRVFTNIGNGYDKMSSVFTVPEGGAGTYVFLFHGLCQFGNKMWLDLYKNHRYVVSAIAHTTNAFTGASNAVVLELVEGDDVHVQGRGDFVLFGKTEEIYVTFNGYLLYPDVLRHH